jgi:hypothetical protein
MSTDRDVTRIVRSWLEEGATALPDRVLDAVLDQVPATSQRRALWPARRFRELNNALKFTMAATAVVVVAIVGINLLPRSGGVGGPVQTVAPTPRSTPSPSAASSQSPAPSPSPSPARIPDGPLAAGTYSTQPFAGSGGLCAGQTGCIEAGAEDDSIRITLTLPDGWVGFGAAVVPSVESYSPPGGAALMFWRGGWLYSQLCGGAVPDIPTGTTVEDFVTALVDHPDLDVTSPVDVTLGGYSGSYLELRAPANTTTDELGPEPSGCNYYFVWQPGIYAQGPNAMWRIWVLDVDGVRVVVRADSFPGTSSEVQAQLQAIVDSIQIER